MFQKYSAMNKFRDIHFDYGTKMVNLTHIIVQFQHNCYWKRGLQTEMNVYTCISLQDFSI